MIQYGNCSNHQHDYTLPVELCPLYRPGANPIVLEFLMGFQSGGAHIGHPKCLPPCNWQYSFPQSHSQLCHGPGLNLIGNQGYKYLPRTLIFCTVLQPPLFGPLLKDNGFFSLISLLIGAAQIANAKMCNLCDGHITMHAACCGPYSMTLNCQWFFLRSQSVLFPIIADMQQEDICSASHSPKGE